MTMRMRYVVIIATSLIDVKSYAWFIRSMRYFIIRCFISLRLWCLRCIFSFSLLPLRVIYWFAFIIFQRHHCISSFFIDSPSRPNATASRHRRNRYHYDVTTFNYCWPCLLRHYYAIVYYYYFQKSITIVAIIVAHTLSPDTPCHHYASSSFITPMNIDYVMKGRRCVGGGRWRRRPWGGHGAQEWEWSKKQACRRRQKQKRTARASA